jgi:restriction system protein
MLAFWQLWLVIGLFSVGRFTYDIWRNRRLAGSGIEEIDRMDGRTFERYLRAVFARKGFAVELTRYVGDYGTDLVLRRGETKTVVQAKRAKSRVGIKAVQEAAAAKGYYGCEDAMVVTNSAFTHQARELAACNGIRLWGREELIRELVIIRGNVPMSGNEQNAEKQPASPARQSSDRNSCVICGKHVSEKVRLFCESKSSRFSGQIYCFDHQRLARLR